MYKVILDTNFIITALKFRIDIFSELQRICNFKYTINILDKSIDELENLIKKNKIKKTTLDLIRRIIKIKKIKIIKTRGNNVDNLLLKQKNAIIATQDKRLKDRLKKKKIPIIVIRQKNHLELKNVL